MPTAEYEFYDYKLAKVLLVKAKLAVLGIDPRSRKYDKLYFRMIRK